MLWQFPMTGTKTSAQKIEALLDIKYEALYLQQWLIGGHTGEYPRLEAAFESLVDRFYRENEEMVTRGQYEAARGSFEYFMVFVERLLSIYKEEE